jgi:hypothetical protein
MNCEQAPLHCSAYAACLCCDALLGNGSVNTFQHEIMGAVSQWTNVTARCKAAVSAPMNWLNGDQVVTPTEASRNSRESCVFYVVCATQQYGSCVFCALVRAAAI